MTDLSYLIARCPSNQAPLSGQEASPRQFAFLERVANRLSPSNISLMLAEWMEGAAFALYGDPQMSRRGKQVCYRNCSSMAIQIWREAVPPEGSLVEPCLATRGRILAASGPFVSRFHPACYRDKARLPAMIALLTDAVTGKSCGIHGIYLQPDGFGKANGNANTTLSTGCHPSSTMPMPQQIWACRKHRDSVERHAARRTP